MTYIAVDEPFLFYDYNPQIIQKDGFLSIVHSFFHNEIFFNKIKQFKDCLVIELIMQQIGNYWLKKENNANKIT